MAEAEAADYYFKRFSIEHGLSHATVNTILRDHRGTLWVGTPLGLNQVDRGSIKKYFYPSVEHPLSQAGAVVRLFEGRDHQLWAVTNHGLYSYEPTKDDFTVKIERPIQSVCEVEGGHSFRRLFCSLPMGLSISRTHSVAPAEKKTTQRRLSGYFSKAD